MSQQAANPGEQIAQQQELLKRKKKYTRVKNSPVREAAIIARYTAGDTKSQISSDLGIARDTVYRILNDEEIRQQIAIGRSRAIALIPKSLDVAEYRLSKNDGTMAIAIMRGTQVLRNEQVIDNSLNIASLQIWQLKQEQAADVAPAIATSPVIDVPQLPADSTLLQKSAEPSTKRIGRPRKSEQNKQVK